MNLANIRLTLFCAVFGVVSFLVITNTQRPDLYQFLELYLMFAPALIFPIIVLTCVKPANPNAALVYLICCSLTYHACGWVTTRPVEIPYIYILMGAIGAALVMTATVFILDAKLPKQIILAGALAGGISFIPQYIFFNAYGTGTSLFLWIFFVGFLINFYKIKSDQRNIR